MNQPNKLPNGFSPFKELLFCSNNFINGVVPIEVFNHHVLLVGKGLLPRVWLAAPESMKGVTDGSMWRYVVEANKSLQRNIEVKSRPKSVVVSLGISIILEVSKVSDDKAEVSWLDLRLLGFNIHGDKDVLVVGTNELALNTFQNVHTMVGVGDD